MKKPSALTIALGCCAFVAASALAQTQSLPKTHLRVVGSISSLPQYKEYEVPFWTKQLNERSGGAITAEIRGFNEMGLKGPEVLRLMGQGVMEIGSTVISYLAADDPANEMVDLAGLLPDVATARAVTESTRPVYDKLYREKFGVELLGFGTYPAQVLFCNGEIKGLQDVRGKKVRVAGRSLSELLEALGATPVTMSFGEVVPALQNRTVDCAITGSLSGNLAKWHEVTTHLLALPLSWNQIVYAVNAKTWNGYKPEVRAFIGKEIQRLEKDVWDAADTFTQQGYECNAGTDKCTMGQKGKMTVVQPSAADRELLRKIVNETTLPKWAARCSAQCVADFNATVGKLTGVQARR
ncbi:MAG TPA: TRAP transporter substrate-binding protein [Burkholderiaceae bacterium]|nr:TRAP transporter substrate-binding protein [Burkholderiaceae bacterium]